MEKPCRVGKTRSRIVVEGTSVRNERQAGLEVVEPDESGVDPIGVDLRGADSAGTAGSDLE